jgi:hypothetical protein
VRLLLSRGGHALSLKLFSKAHDRRLPNSSSTVSSEAAIMGLAERKVKQKIGNDPRNLTWSQGKYKVPVRQD